MARGGDEKDMAKSASISSRIVETGHILQVHAKAAELAERAKILQGMYGVAAGDSAENANLPLEEPDKQELSFAANRAEQLIKLAKDYAEFAENYPRIAASILPVISLGAKAMVGAIVGSAAGPGGTIAGAASGLAAGVIAEVQGWFVGELAGEQLSRMVNAGIEKVSGAVKAFDPTLTDEQAQALGAAVVLGGIAGIQGRAATKEALGVLSKISAGKGLNQDVLFSKGHGDRSTGVTQTAKQVVVGNPHITRKYIKEVEDITGRKVAGKQVNELKQAIQGKEFRKLTKTEYDLHRKEWDTKRDALRVEWEKNTGQKWPTYAVSTVKDGKIETKPRPYDAHHIIKVDHGGTNEWWNIHPAHPTEHKIVHGTDSIARKIFDGGIQ